MGYAFAMWVVLPLIAAGHHLFSHPSAARWSALKEAAALMAFLYGVELAVTILFHWSHS